MDEGFIISIYSGEVHNEDCQFKSTKRQVRSDMY
jgi:hypothetical protein